MKKIVALFFVISLVAVLAGCSQKSDKLTVAVDDTYPPMEYRNEEMELVGFDIDFANALAEEMGVEIEFVSTAWDGIFEGLKSDKYDCIISSVSITPERLENLDFSVPYLSNGQVIVVGAGSDVITSPEQLEGKKVGVQLQTTADIAATKQLEVTSFELFQYDDIMQTFADLGTGRLDCIVVDYAVAIEYSSKNPDDYIITSAQLTNEPIGVCVKKGNTELLDKLNKAIKTLQDNGTMKKISEEHLGGDYVSNIDVELR